MRAVAICSLVLCLGLASAARADNTRPPAAQSILPTPVAPPQTVAAKNPASLEVSVETKPSADDELLTAKLAELKRLQDEIQKLRQSATQAPQIRIDLQICKLSLTRLQQLGVDLSKLGLALPGPPATPQALSATTHSPTFVGSANSQFVAGLVEILRRQGVVELLTITTLTQTTTDGRKTYFLHGRGFLTVDEARAVRCSDRGTQIEMTPTRLGDRRLRLDTLIKVTEPDPSVSITLNGRKLAGFRSHEMEAPCEMELGTTAIYCGLMQQNQAAVVDPATGAESMVTELDQMLFLFTPSLVDTAAN